MDLEIARGPRKSQSCDAIILTLPAQAGFTHIFILNENIHATCAETLSAREVGATPKIA